MRTPQARSGFFAAVMVGAILSSFNSALNSTATLFSLGVYRHLRPGATEEQVIGSGKVFGWVIAVTSMTVAPLLAGQESIFGYLQKMNGLYFIPIFAVVLVGMLSKRVPAAAANVALILGFTMAALVTSRWAKVLWTVWPSWVWFTVMATGNHYWLDVVAGIGLALVSVSLVMALESRREPGPSRAVAR